MPRTPPGGTRLNDQATGLRARPISGRVLLQRLLVFRDFDALPFPDVPAIRIYISADPVFGAVTFTGVLIGPADVEIASFDIDTDYWQVVADEPEDGGQFGRHPARPFRQQVTRVEKADVVHR